MFCRFVFSLACVLCIATALYGVPNAVAEEAAVMVTHSEGVIKTHRPVGDGWECVEDTAAHKGATARLVKCRSTDAARFFFMMVKVYDVPEKFVRTAEDLVTEVYKKNYDKMFADIKYTRQVKAAHQGHPGYEGEFVAQHQAKGEIRKIERVIVKGSQVFLVSVEGNAEHFKALDATISAWFDQAWFEALAQK